MVDSFSSKDLVLRLIHVEGLGHGPELSGINREAARQILLGRSGKEESTTADDIVCWFLTECTEATEADRNRVAMAWRVANIEQKIATRLKPFRKV